MLKWLEVQVLCLYKQMPEQGRHQHINQVQTKGPPKTGTLLRNSYIGSSTNSSTVYFSQPPGNMSVALIHVHTAEYDHLRPSKHAGFVNRYRQAYISYITITSMHQQKRCKKPKLATRHTSAPTIKDITNFIPASIQATYTNITSDLIIPIYSNFLGGSNDT